MNNSAGPLRTTRLLALSIAWAFAVIAASVGLNALVKSNQMKTRLKKAVAPPTVVSINTSDILNAGIVVTAGTTLLSVLIFNYIAAMFLPATRALSLKTLRLQAISLIITALFVLGAMIGFIFYFATRHAIVKAFIGTVQLPDSLVKATEQSMHSTSVYKEIDYLKLLATFPWIAIFFSFVAAGILLAADSRARKVSPTTHHAHPASPSIEISEKESIVHNEKADVRV
ncbi:hypothetical protein BDQ12DRAFT_637561 [Crucibulum laeve]|uniref:Uncharacterized protein n=1 Tax=Crucibulum laeve TaxID=68775 RepID=A0A5C3LLC4_9AGAR|nr:hypothetical protein BDQ12DRAFT_637561 [Crucibulum laeve]